MPVHIGNIGNLKENGLHLNLQVARGEPFYVELDLDEEENDFSTWELKMTIQERSTKNEILSLDSSPGFVFNTTTGKLLIQLTETQTELFQEGVVYDFDIRVQIPGSNSSIIFWGRVSAETWITQG